jgi:hypothetical protein
MDSLMLALCEWILTERWREEEKIRGGYLLPFFVPLGAWDVIDIAKPGLLRSGWDDNKQSRANRKVLF